VLVCLVCCVMVRVCFWSLALHCIIHSPKNKRLLCSAKSVGLFLPFYLCIHVGHTLRGFPIFEPQRFAFLNSIFFFLLFLFPGLCYLRISCFNFGDLPAEILVRAVTDFSLFFSFFYPLALFISFLLPPSETRQ